MGGKRRREKPAPLAPPPPARRLWSFGLFAAVLAAVAVGVVTVRHGPASPVIATKRSRDNVLLITLDTTRADRLGAYGYAAAKTRHLDHVAAEGVRFEQAVAVAPITLPAHASLFTGLYPFEHGVRNNGNFYLAETHETLATVLRAQGYHTAAFVSSFILDRRYGLAHGFEVYDDRMEGAEPQIVSLEAERRGDRTALALSAWLESYARDPGAPFFAWLHLYDPHEPYRPPPPFREAFANAPYDGEIAFDDAIVASILDKLAGLGLRDHTLVAVTADHGESLGDHGEETHSMFVYESAVRVPLILWRPGRLPAGRVVTELVSAIDLAPTILDLVGAPPLVAPHARSLLPLIEAPSASPAPPAYSETLLPKFYMNWAPLRAIRDQRFKLIDAPKAELYDLQQDPAETRNLYTTQPQRAAVLRAGLDRLTAGAEGAMSVSSLDRDAIEKLAALGYLGAGGADTGDSSRPLADPKDFIAIFNQLRRANSAVRDGRFGQALPILERVLKADPKNAFAQLVLGSAYMGMGDNSRAIAQYRRYVALVPTSSYAHQWMAICYLRLGDRDGALREAEAALALDPRFSDARVMKAGILASRGRRAEAAAELRRAIETDPAKPILRLDLAKILSEAGRTEEARAEYETLLKLDPQSSAALTGLAALLAGQGDLAGAASRLEQALAHDPRALEARFNLAQVYERQKRADLAAVEYERLAADPQAAAELRSVARARLEGLAR